MKRVLVLMLRMVFVGSLLSVAAYGEFIRNDDKNVVADTEQNLMWQDDTSVTLVNKIWTATQDYCNGLNVGGYDDWRVPNIDELSAIYIEENPIHSYMDNTFLNVASQAYWSSTIDPTNSNYALGVNFYGGYITKYGITGTATYNTKVRCVRDITVDNIESNTINLIIHNGITYNTVTSPYTGRVWLDRNLGASQVCTAYNDEACYGDYYQWGRDADGHEKYNSETTTSIADSITPNHTKFILNSSIDEDDWSSADENGSLRSANWSKTDGSSICPIGFRVPTDNELQQEIVSLNNKIDVFDSFLKIPSAGVHDNLSGTMMGDDGSWGYIWSSTFKYNYPQSLQFYDTNAYINNSAPADG
ncbi:MAG: DUF1566 domain-containing protein, partial [Campylobacterales bacterium]|nr:DUF1566 domain-containing protein [Campylobacterales bacterium]